MNTHNKSENKILKHSDLTEQPLSRVCPASSHLLRKAPWPQNQNPSFVIQLWEPRGFYIPVQAAVSQGAGVRQEGAVGSFGAVSTGIIAAMLLFPDDMPFVCLLVLGAR